MTNKNDKSSSIFEAVLALHLFESSLEKGKEIVPGGKLFLKQKKATKSIHGVGPDSQDGREGKSSKVFSSHAPRT